MKVSRFLGDFTFTYRLTKWVEQPTELAFVVKHLHNTGKPFILVHRIRRGWAVYIDTPTFLSNAWKAVGSPRWLPTIYSHQSWKDFDHVTQD